MFSKRIILSASLVMVSAPALAHTGGSHASGFAAGFSHPLGGADHMLAMVAVGVLASRLGGRALWAVPASFVVMMLIGGALGFSGIEMPAVEIGIAASIVVLGAAVALARSWTVRTSATLVGAFAVFHGYAHGTEMPGAASAAAYSVGFATATALVHGMGILVGNAFVGKPQMVRFAGAATALAGFALILV
jgi:urease accessory protein